MDNEDRRQATYVSGWTGATYANGSGNLVFTFCRVDGNQFKPLATGSSVTTNYAVLKLAAACPAGSVEFIRHFDNEDTRNQTSSSPGAEIWPNVQDGNVTLRFCLFRGGSAPAASLPTLGFEYGVFATQSFARGSASGIISSDDEDTRNSNGYYVDAAWAADAKAIVSEGENTVMSVARGGGTVCGDNLCIGSETENSCPSDCTRCGNGVCGPRENAGTCIDDCGTCGDGYCSPSRESTVTCPEDCSYCGDGVCDAREPWTCPEDCGLSCNVTSGSQDGLIPTCP
ncbi:hypothetical protein [Myxococcus landrumensis]|uniref:Lipoprotein n=1 Tax=Myxococcus landrumensis TaxID=2813577 RepID=A0ABX7NJE1_9BACT|nr:hypothetical protein [Myxococcus landrumus]QSQ17506.1 hypothetical protein JY572_16325 [Myxococcus landrumus]